LPIAV
jgi:hypothetical protein